ncbi:GNAT family N-acetyltransferase [Acidisphaera sp. L21]|uniref:GNAT family N-acetyltransferase n=1 Tax=Acidisphaera sp. L21 TaxID=1641851 RepID=UPI00131A7358|nr:GNAT family N-acetyltransferase [Acidisphaera sp. L21]
MMLMIETATHEDAFGKLAAEWDAMEMGSMPRTPFQSSAWHRMWWQNFRRSGMKVRDELRLYTVRDASHRLVAVAPMMLTHRPAHLPIRTRELQFLGADSNVTEIRGMICRDGWQNDALNALVDHLETTREWDWVQWRGLPGTRPPAIPKFRPTRELQDFYLPLPENWETLKSGLPRNMKEALRKCYNSLARDKHEHEIAVISDPAEVNVAFARLLDMHAMRSELDGTIHHINVFAAPEARAFITQYVADMAAAGNVRIFALKIAGEAVAMRIGFTYEGELYLYYSGYDPAWGKYSVMTTVVAEAIKWAIEHGCARVNLSTGSDVSKTRWRPAQVDFIEGVQPSSSLRGQIALAVADMLRDGTWRPPFNGPRGGGGKKKRGPGAVPQAVPA